ncbi:hypothetical protein E2C01_045120 [Portunus trituberculatus]|uniref:Uncharacterized protein n=1 Tax=Portunus trituberculatus TaxID=210409 RepID=A0A5B7G0E2_PORTR|nr:hypothetical protein [Portunus trituberculatus]
MKPNEEAHKGTSLTNVKLKTNPMQECVMNGEELTWQIPETELTDSNSLRYPSQPARKWESKLNDTPYWRARTSALCPKEKFKKSAKSITEAE